MSETWMSSFSQRIKPFYLSTNYDIEKIFQEAKRRLELTSGSGQHADVRSKSKEIQPTKDTFEQSKPKTNVNDVLLFQRNESHKASVPSSQSFITKECPLPKPPIMLYRLPSSFSNQSKPLWIQFVPRSVDFSSTNPLLKKRKLLAEEALKQQSKPHEADDPPFGCFLYCSLFPVGYEFEEDMLIQLWMAEGFIEERASARLEDTGRSYFHFFVAKGFIVPSNCHLIDANRPKYRVSDNRGSRLQQLSCNQYLLVEDVVDLSDKLGDGTGLLHLSFHAKIGSMNFEAVKKCEYLRTLLIFPCHGSCIRQVPRDLFLRLNQLRTLKLSHTHVFELPSSIASVISLRYIDVSKTPITTLPESTSSLYNLQTLKLRGCKCLVALPNGMKKLTNLRHLDVDIVGQLTSMPPRMGNLINLQTLSAFLVGRHDGCRIGELKNLNNLSGEFCISRLESVLNLEEAMEAALMNKKYLNKLELRWSDVRAEKAQEEEDILECLQPHPGLKELHILFYGGSKLPKWIGDPTFADLVDITLHKFKNCQFLPSLGELPSLKYLYIAEMNAMREVNYCFCRNSREDQEHHAFPKLEILRFDVMLNLEGWIGVQNGDFPSLLKLTLDYCPKLIALLSLSSLNSLKHLEIKHCPNLISMPNEGLPSSLEFLLIKNCPELKEQCSKGKGQDWCKIAHVPRIWVDNEEISAR